MRCIIFYSAFNRNFLSFESFFLISFHQQYENHIYYEMYNKFYMKRKSFVMQLCRVSAIHNTLFFKAHKIFWNDFQDDFFTIHFSSKLWKNYSKLNYSYTFTSKRYTIICDTAHENVIKDGMMVTIISMH